MRVLAGTAPRPRPSQWAARRHRAASRVAGCVGGRNRNRPARLMEGASRVAHARDQALSLPERERVYGRHAMVWPVSLPRAHDIMRRIRALRPGTAVARGLW